MNYVESNLRKNKLDVTFFKLKLKLSTYYND